MKAEDTPLSSLRSALASTSTFKQELDKLLLVNKKKEAKKEFKQTVLKAYREIGTPKATFLTAELLKDPDPDVRFQALDTLSQIKTTESMEAVLPMLLDGDAYIRWKAVHTLGQIGDPRAAGHINFLLGDPDKSVRGISPAAADCREACVHRIPGRRTLKTPTSATNRCARHIGRDAVVS